MAKWQYGIVVDAGSSGSRIHVYRWLNSAHARQDADGRTLHSLPVVKTKKNWTKKIKPGISTFGDKPNLVGPDHLKEIFDHALDIIPPNAVEETPLFLLATAGMRLLPDRERKELLKQVCSYAQKNTSFLIPDCDLHIQVIPGETEGLYGWIAANYLLGGFDSPEEHDHGKGHHTYGFLDMGGASAQIAFAPNATEAERHANDLTLLRMRNVDGEANEYRVFVTTWLGFGVHQARQRYVDALLAGANPIDGELPDPCLPVGLRVKTTGDILSRDLAGRTEVHLLGTGKFAECLSSTFPLLNKDAICNDPPCLLNGVHVPAIDFDVNHFVGVSEYWHTTHEIFEIGHKEKAYDFNTYQKRVKEFCTENWKTIEEEIKDKKLGDKVDEATAAEVCFKASWLINVLHEGIGIPRIGLEDTKGNGHNGTKEVLDKAKEKGFTDPFQAVDKIDDTEVSWTLGRMVLYAASQVPPARESALPVGFGNNTAGAIPPDFQYGGTFHSISANKTLGHESDDGKDILFRTPRRIPGFLLFMLIICIAVFLLCGKDRRSRLYHKLTHTLFRGGRPTRRKGIIGNKTLSFMHSRADSNAQERLLESGMHNPEDFELGVLDDDFEDYSDSSSHGKTGKTSGIATPIIRTPKLELGSALDLAGQVKGLGGGALTNAMDRSGLFVRTESRERLMTIGTLEGRKSRKGSPTRFKGVGMGMGTLAED